MGKIDLKNWGFDLGFPYQEDSCPQVVRNVSFPTWVASPPPPPLPSGQLFFLYHRPSHYPRLQEKTNVSVSLHPSWPFPLLPCWLSHFLSLLSLRHQTTADLARSSAFVFVACSRRSSQRRTTLNRNHTAGQIRQRRTTESKREVWWKDLALLAVAMQQSLAPVVTAPDRKKEEDASLVYTERQDQDHMFLVPTAETQSGATFYVSVGFSG